MSKGEASRRKLAAHPEKALFQIWLLLVLGLVQRFLPPSDGILVIYVPLVLLVLAGPAYLAGVVLYYNKNLKDQGKAWLIGSAALVTIFGLYLFFWAI